MYSVYQHWDPLKVCVVGRSYPPEFYSWITKPAVRSLFEKIAIETEEDYQAIIKKLKSFGVQILRPDLPRNTFVNDQYVAPPMTPRDYTIMIGDTYFDSDARSLVANYNKIKDINWPTIETCNEFDDLPDWIQRECNEVHNIRSYSHGCYEKINQHIVQQGNSIVYEPIERLINGAMVSRIGTDLYFSTEYYNQDQTEHKKYINSKFTNTRNHIIDTGGHGDGTYCPVCPGLIISLHDVPSYADTFPGWEVVYLPYQSWAMVKDFLHLKNKNGGKWWIPGFEYNQDVVDTVEQWLGHWTGYVEETVFDVNMLIVDPKNVIVFNYNKKVFDALDRYGITPHVVPFRHRYFWDGGIHCVTSDLHREGSIQDYFPGRA